MGVIRAAFGLRLGFAIISMILAGTFIVTPLPARADGSNLAARAQPLGKPLSTIVEFGEQYVTGDAPYELRITVVKVLRGAPAEELVKSASASNPRAKAGFEYVAARVRLEFSARVSPANYSYTLDPSQFSAISPDGAEYPAPSLAAQPKPGLHATLRSGDSADGWLVLLVPRSDRTPLMLFVPHLGTTSHSGNSSVFRLYAASLGSGANSSYAIARLWDSAAAASIAIQRERCHTQS
ncbi:MAG: hypothetical protein ACRD4X_10525 [Candidatus Acidiferrales bacterium]